LSIIGFERLNDFVRNTFVTRVGEFFNAQTGFLRDVSSEIPNIEKYEVTEEQERFSSSVHIQRYFADLFEKLPLIAITSTGAREAFNQVGIQEFMDENSLRVVSSTTENYTLADEDNLLIKVDDKEYDIIFETEMFTDISDISIDEFRSVMDQLFIFLRVEATDDKLTLYDRYGRALEIVNGTAVTKLGFTNGQVAEAKYHKYSLISETMDAVIDVVTSDRNQRIEIMDLLSSLFGFYVYDKYLGQWVESEGFVFFTTNYVRRGESETTLEGAPVDKLYFDSMTIPVRAFVQIDRVQDIEDLEFIPTGVMLL
jgi:hypothetical protein